MSWRLADKKDLDLLLPFLLREEWRSVVLSALFRKLDGASFPPYHETQVHLLCRGKEIRGLLAVTSTGLLLPLLEKGPAAEGFALRANRSSLHSIMGTAQDVLWMEGCLPLKPSRAVDYHLMVLSREDHSLVDKPPLEPAPGLCIRSAGQADLQALFPLQKSYELEEVVLEPGHFSGRACLANLKRALRSQVVMLAELEGRVVAKAGTNARGFQTDQIGGVYTLGEERKRGFSFRVLEALLERLFREKRTVSLFVKKTNLPALRLYQKLGFSTADSYRISYFF